MNFQGNLSLLVGKMKGNTEVTCDAYDCESNDGKGNCDSCWITLNQLDGREFACENYRKRVGGKER